MIPRPDHLQAADNDLVEGVLARRPRALAKAITLIESTRRDHQARAEQVLAALLPHTGKAIRVGISGAPGAGKSTFIEALGLHLIERGHRVAVLAVDPSSTLSGGSILGDKTRMEKLAAQPNAFIRPSPSGGSLGGVAERTREAMLVCEAAGFDVVLVETVGVGQSEVSVAGMVDVFALLQMPNAGDDLQAMKKGIVELADVIAINKADIDPRAAETAKRQLEVALALLRGAPGERQVRVLALSAHTGKGIAGFWGEVERLAAAAARSGELEARRRRQALDWMWALIEGELRRRFRHHPSVSKALEPVCREVAAGRITPAAAANRLLAYLNG
ncbi:MAG: methylmalonyl Co-A mutase-associated GTPase MeaB [Rhodocyclaceae bacterium]